MDPNVAGHTAHDVFSGHLGKSQAVTRNWPAVWALQAGVVCLFAVTSGSAQVRTDDTEQAQAAGEKVLELSRFVVTEDKDAGYRATSTLAGTRIKTDIRDIGSALSVVTGQFLEDTASRSSQDLLVYTTGTEIAGPTGNFTGTGNAEVLTERGSMGTPHNNTRVRGLADADNTRDLFLTDIPWDNYYVDRIELQRGPNSILYGLGKPGGVINASLKQAAFRDITKLNTRFGRFGSARGALDVGRVLVKDQLALRVNLLKDREYFQQEPAFSDDERFFAALRYDPAFLNRGSARTSLRINYEIGLIEANRPRSMPPMDRLTPWFQTGTTTVGGRTFNNLNQFTGDFRYRNAYFASVPNSGFLVATSPGFQPGITDANNGMYAYFTDPTTGVPTNPYYTPQTFFTETYGLAPNGTIDGTIRGLFSANKWVMVATTSELMRRLGVPFAFSYKNKSITDSSIYDFYNHLIDGPNKSERQKFDAFNATLSQTFLKGKVGIEAAYDHQDYDYNNQAYFWGLGTGDAAITVDVNTHLPDQTPNPNVGRPMIVQRTINGGTGRATVRDVFNVTGYLELHAKDYVKTNWLGKLLGRHILTASASRNQVDGQLDTWASAALEGPAWDTEANKAITFRREFATIAYLGSDMRGLSSPAGLNLSNVSGRLSFPDQNMVIFNSNWNRPTNPSTPGYVNPGAPWVNPFNNQTLTQSENPANYVGWQSVPVKTITFDGNNDLLTFASTKTRNVVSSKFLVWQGFLFDGLVVPTFGYRKDTAKSYTARAPVTIEGIVDRTPALNQLPGQPDDTVSGESKSYSLVVHAPAFIRRLLPAGMDVSLLYNRSSNFEPLAGRIDVLGRTLGNPTGKTEDYGIVITALDDRLRLKVNQFKAGSTNVSYAPQNLHWLMQIESTAWIRAKQFEAGLSGNPAYEGPTYNYGTLVNGVFTQTAADRARQQRDVAAVLNTFAPEIWTVFENVPSDERWQNNQIEAVYARLPTGYTGTQDTLSEGYEIEVNFRPVRNWNITLNASRTKAMRSNIGGEALNAWVDARNAVWNGAGGEILNSGTGVGTLGDMWNNNFFNTYLPQRLQNGTAMPEMRLWRVNLISNYNFIKGRLKGFKVGGAYRWEDKVGIGYQPAVVTINGEDLESIDLSKPFWGPSTTTVDAWVGYTRKLNKRINWQVQLNVRNLLGENELVPINIQPDGTAAAFRIRNGPSWSISNNFEF
mgnify:CR=1 FL=1